MAFTEFYCDASNGSNVNAGDNKSITTTTNGAYTQGGGAGGNDLFTATGGTPFSAASVGDFVSIYNDGATLTTFIGRITAINSGGLSIDISLTAVSGTRPSTVGTGKTATIGGTWKGPNAAENFPFGFITNLLTNASIDAPRVNFKNNAVYSISGGITHALTGTRFEGYTSTIGDGGLANIDGGANAITLLTVSGTNNSIVSFRFSNNGTTGSNSGLLVSGVECYIKRCVANGIRGNGIDVTANNCYIVECEAYDCNKSNSGTTGGFRSSSSSSNAEFARCISRYNLSGNANGFVDLVGSIYHNCIADGNGGGGWLFGTANNAKVLMVNCDILQNSGHGLAILSTNQILINLENINFIRNSGWAMITTGASTGMNGEINNCRFGSGAQANASGTISGFQSILVNNTFPYSSNTVPWSQFAAGNLTIDSAESINSGRGNFLYSTGTYSGTYSNISIGAAQNLSSVQSTTVISTNNTVNQQSLPNLTIW